jgi:hypothetical protein
MHAQPLCYPFFERLGRGKADLPLGRLERNGFFSVMVSMYKKDCC